MVAIEFLSPDHAFPLIVIVLVNFMVAYLAMNVGKARKKYDVKYPAMYSDKDPVFNCYQRAHQNTLEALPLFFSLFIPSALVFPRVASVLGMIWVCSRISYARGYWTGDPKKRLNGTYGYLGILGMLALTVYIIVAQFGFV